MDEVLAVFFREEEILHEHGHERDRLRRSRVWFNGRMRPCQGRDEGSIPFTRLRPTT